MLRQQELVQFGLIPFQNVAAAENGSMVQLGLVLVLFHWSSFNVTRSSLLTLFVSGFIRLDEFQQGDEESSDVVEVS